MTQTNAKNEVTLEIDALSYGPYGVGRLDGKAVMVPHTAPGDQIIARIVESKERYSTAELTRVMAPSPLRQTPPCPYVSDCGGCSWQHLRYNAQLKAKQQSVDDALRRIGKLSGYELRPIIVSYQEYHYRRRIRLQCDERKQLGFYQSSSHRLVQIERCLIADDRLNGVLDSLRRWIPNLATVVDFVEIVAGDEPNQLVVVVAAASEFPFSDETHCEQLAAQDSAIRGLIVFGPGWRKVWGQPWIAVNLNDELSLTVDADVFTQVNPAGNRQILAELIKASEFQSSDRVLELYCGAGNFTLPIAKLVANVVAVEGYRPALANAKLNAQKYGLENIRWSGESVPVTLGGLKKRHENFTKIVLDPPRSGAKGIEQELAALNAQRIVYVSCNPATLARDVAALTQQGFKLTAVQPIDLFPHTFHVETIAILTST
jgi:23S rRNA (uracil1939-C5)-methyltransferase